MLDIWNDEFDKQNMQNKITRYNTANSRFNSDQPPVAMFMGIIHTSLRLYSSEIFLKQCTVNVVPQMDV